MSHGLRRGTVGKSPRNHVAMVQEEKQPEESAAESRC